MEPRATLPRAATVIVTLTAFSLVAGNQPAAAQSGFQWFALDSAPPGAPPTIVLQSTSNPQQTVLDVTIHGFYYETIVRMNQTFRRLSLRKTRDEAAYRQVGRPELPALHHLLGALVGAAVGTPQVQVIDEVTIPGAVIFPAQPPVIEDQGHAPFQWDQAFYQQTSQPYPAARGADRGYRGRFNRLGLVAAETYPFRAIPASQVLLVARRFMVTIPHAGSGSPVTMAITRRQAKQYELLLDNYPVVAAFRPVLAAGFAGDYLFITAPAFVEEIDPLADQKRRRGFAVTVMTTDETGATCNEIKTAIADWWNAGDPDRDHYVLLVGDDDRVPICPSENLTASDKVYACIDGLGDDGRADVYPEVRLGRLPCDTETECSDMVAKTLIYEDGYPGSGSWLGDVLLACHKRADAEVPDQYRDAQETVRTYPFSAPVPVFSTFYGQEGATNAEVRAAVDAGRGVVCYRGHGSTTAWSDWNNAGEYFDLNQVGLLDNGIRTPVVFALACLNGFIGNGDGIPADGIGEKWMKTRARAVAHFGATGCSDRSANDLLDLELFETIWEDNHPILGEAIAGAEAATIIADPLGGEANAWMYLLLGDPELKVWREAPEQLLLSGHPVSVPTGPQTFIVQVHRNGVMPAPVEFAIVSLFKEGEIAENRYTDGQGIAEVPIDPATPGIIEVVAYTEFGSEGVVLATIEVTETTAAGETSAAAPGTFVLTAPAAAGGLELGVGLPEAAAGLRIRVLDVAGRARASETLGMLAPGQHRIDLGAAGARSLPRGIYWVEARARWSGDRGGESRARARWLKAR